MIMGCKNCVTWEWLAKFLHVVGIKQLLISDFLAASVHYYRAQKVLFHCTLCSLYLWLWQGGGWEPLMPSQQLWQCGACIDCTRLAHINIHSLSFYLIFILSLLIFFHQITYCTYHFLFLYFFLSFFFIHLSFLHLNPSYFR